MQFNYIKTGLIVCTIMICRNVNWALIIFHVKVQQCEQNKILETVTVGIEICMEKSSSFSFHIVSLISIVHAF